MDPDRTFLERFEHHFREIEKELNRTFGSRVSTIDDIGRHSLLGEGKRIRPLLFVLSSRLCGYEGKDVYLISTMFEYIHSASLLHDDVIDNADVRRNKPSASHIWGNSAAVLTGDFLSSMAAAIAVSTDNIDVIRTAIDTSTRMVEGQFLELTHTNDWNVSKDEYLEIITSKTGELMSAACACGAVIAGAEKDAKEGLKNFGLYLGMAFQLTDDLLDYESSEEKFGKPVGKDLREGKTTLPLIYALRNLGKKEVERLRDRFKNHRADEKDYSNIIEFVRSSGVLDRIRSEAGEYVRKASGFLDIFPESPHKKDLIALNEYIAKRHF